MSIAQYNRGNRAMSADIDRKLHGYSQCDLLRTPKTRTDSGLPEGLLRSSYLPEECLKGTAIFLSYEKGWYVIHSRWQNFARRRDIHKAIKLFEKIEMYGLEWLKVSTS